MHQAFCRSDPAEGVHATSNQGARLALNPLVCPDTLWAAPVSRSCCGFTDCVEGSPLPSTRCLMAPCPVTRLSHVRETARPGGGRVCRPINLACVLLRGVPHVCVLPCLARLGPGNGLISFCPSTALWRTVAWQDCQSRAAAQARWCVCRTKALQVGPATSAATF